MKKCFKCGSEIAEEEKKCPKCKALKATKENLEKCDRVFGIWLIVLAVIIVLPSIISGSLVVSIPGVLPLIFVFDAARTRKEMRDFLQEEEGRVQDI